MVAVDVVIPCFKYAHYLEACVASVLAQAGVEPRILIVDDCSPDNTPEVAARLVAGDARVNYTRNPKNLGLIGSINVGALDWAKAPYCLVLSADDALAPGGLACLVEALERHPEAQMSYGMARIFKDAIPVGDAPADPATMTMQVIDGETFLAQSCDAGNPVPSPTALVRTAIQRDTGGYNANFRHTSDMEMWMRLATFGPVVAVKQTLGYYRWHGANMSSELGDAAVDLRHRLATCEYVYAQWKDEGAQLSAATKKRIHGALLETAAKAAMVALDQNSAKGFEDCMAFAAELQPGWRISPNGLRLTARKLMGWKLRRSAIGNRLSTPRFPQRKQPQAQDWRDAGGGDIFGWWPQPAAA